MPGWDALGPVYFLAYSGLLVFVGWILGRITGWDAVYKRGLDDAMARFRREFAAAPHCRAVPLSPIGSGYDPISDAPYTKSPSILPSAGDSKAWDLS